MNTTNPFQRALVFQGGGSLGAYEAGVYKATYELLSERDVKLGREGKPLFHIVPGTSIGAMNAAVTEVPPLRVFIVNVHPIKQNSLPADYDALVDRKNDLTFNEDLV